MSDDHDSNTNDTRPLHERMRDASGLGVAGADPLVDPLTGEVFEKREPRLPPHDLETGEILDEEPVALVPPQAEREAQPDPAPVAQAAPPQPEPAPQTTLPPAEVIEPERAADGAPMPFAARDTGALINLLEGGQFSADTIAAMTALANGMTEIAQATGKRQKGTLTIKINLQTDETGEAFFVNGDFTVRAPKLERRKTLLWQDDKGHMSPSQPRQRVFFGVKDAGGGQRQIRDASAEARRL